MDDLSIAWARFGPLHIDIFFDFRINLEVANLIGRAGLECELFRNLKNKVGLADRPAFDEFWRGRQLFRIALFCALSYPGDDGFGRGIGHPAVVGPFANLWISVPGRHFALSHSLSDSFGPGTNIFICQGREWRSFARSMALSTVLVEDRRDVFAEGNAFVSLLGVRTPCAACAASADGWQDKKSGGEHRCRSDNCESFMLHGDRLLPRVRARGDY